LPEKSGPRRLSDCAAIFERSCSHAAKVAVTLVNDRVNGGGPSTGACRRGAIRLLLLAALLLGPVPVAAEALLAVGSWIVASEPDAAGQGDRHVAITPSSRGGGMLGIRCIAKELSVILGLNSDGAVPPEESLPPGKTVEVSLQIGDTARSATATVSPDGTLLFDPGQSRAIIADVAGASLFTFRWRSAKGEDTALVFRPALTRSAIEPLARACGIGG
jgi:hypothetical protein